MRVILDSREVQLTKILYERDLDKYSEKIELKKEQLDIGDIHICYEDKVFVIERKSLADLISSVKDGRYHEQKTRLLASGHDITYVIEGDDIVSSSNQRFQNILSSVYIHSLYRDNIKVIFTKDTSGTATYILTLCTKIIDNPKHFTEKKELSDYIDCVKIKTKKSHKVCDKCTIVATWHCSKVCAGDERREKEEVQMAAQKETRDDGARSHGLGKARTSAAAAANGRQGQTHASATRATHADAG